MFFKKASLHKYADDNTLSAFATATDDLIEILTHKSRETIDWLKLSQMTVNSKTFQAMFISKKENAAPRNLKLQVNNTAQKMKFSIKDFSNTCDQIRRKLRTWSHLLEKFLLENFIFCAV